MNTLDTAIDLFRRGRLEEAEGFAVRALSAASDRRPALVLLAELCFRAGRVDAAIGHCRELAALAPLDAANLRRLGQALLATGRPDAALGPLERARELEPGNPRGLTNLGQALSQLGRQAEALAAFERAVALGGDRPNALTHLALAAERLARFPQALAANDRIIAREPANAEAAIRRGRLLLRMNRPAEALQSVDAGLALRPGDFAALALKTAVLLALAQPAAALATADAALGRNPESAEVLQYRAAALCQLQRHAEALGCLERAVALAPADIGAWCNFAVLETQLGNSAAAERCYRRALAIDPDHVGARCGLVAAMIPPIPRSSGEAMEARTRFERELDLLEAWVAARPLSEDDAWTLARQHFFYASYQEVSNLPLLRRYRSGSAARLARYAPRTPPSASLPETRFRLGIVSAQVADHSVFNAITRGWLETLDRRRFDITLFNLGARRDGSTEFAERCADRAEAGSRSVPEWAELVQSRNLDALLYPEVGIDRNTLALAGLRLAPRQLAAWGHPETTGLPTIDAFLSAEDLEPPDADRHYSERLIRLPNLGVYYQPETVEAAPPDCATFGIAPGVPLLICPGTPFKYDPQDDAVLVEIARRLGACTFLFFTYERAALSERLQHRLAAAFAAAGLEPRRFLTWIPWQSRAAFRGLLGRADVYLDTLRFSGFNTLMQAVETALPCVSHEGRFLRGRLGSGILRRLGLAELIAADPAGYVDIAVRLASDRALRSAVADRMRQAAPCAYRDRGPVEALEQVLLGGQGTV